MMSRCKYFIVVIVALAATCQCTPWVQPPVAEFDLADEFGPLGSYEDGDKAVMEFTFLFNYLVFILIFDLSLDDGCLEKVVWKLGTRSNGEGLRWSTHSCPKNHLSEICQTCKEI